MERPQVDRREGAMPLPRDPECLSSSDERQGHGPCPTEDRGTVPFPLAPVTVVAGHYGVGKTNFSLNLALDAAAAGFQVTLADMDVVNPYFRSSEYRGLLDAAGVRLIAPVFGGAGTALDVPSLTGELSVAVEEAYRSDGRAIVIVDAGGDDVGAAALARFAPAIAAGPYELLYVVNAFRNLTQEPAEAVAVLREIEVKSRLAATAVVGNSHLQGDTVWQHIAESVPFAQAVAAMAGLPLACVTAPEATIQRENAGSCARENGVEVYPVKVYVRPPWTD